MTNLQADAKKELLDYLCSRHLSLRQIDAMYNTAKQQVVKTRGADQNGNAQAIVEWHQSTFGD